ncbi:hypothetical protein [Flagellimonas sediminis]|uniref:Uncharacterized protein n=1 Tax=Flagellimonas sediminis TaxID=2696468 RepID=A0A6I5KXW3_9FLAO|nr:hypothetical protein [Allomuricauda sediminis]NDV42838.1 hypothetical protein [Allomuricauda sediminis]
MKRILIDYKKLDHKVAAILIDSYPDGYGDDDIITIKKPDGEILEAVEVRTEDTIYLVKISKSLSHFISNFEETIERELNKDLEPEETAEVDNELFPTPEFDVEEADNEGLF